MFMTAQAEYKDVCARHEYEFGIHLRHIYIPLFVCKLQRKLTILEYLCKI